MCGVFSAPNVIIYTSNTRFSSVLSSGETIAMLSSFRHSSVMQEENAHRFLQLQVSGQNN
jgi:hypothetical protein